MKDPKVPIGNTNNFSISTGWYHQSVSMNEPKVPVGNTNRYLRSLRYRLVLP